MKPVSLLYHDVVRGDPAASGFRGADADAYKLTERRFVAHLETIAELAASRVQLVWSCAPFRHIGDPLFLTFDDGGTAAHDVIAGLLEMHGWRGHFFIVTNRIGCPGFLARRQIRDLHQRGHNIGSHSHSHPQKFSQLSYEQMVSEWQESRRILTEIMGEPPFTASVPGGFYSADVARSAREAGYSVLFNSEPSCRVSQEGDLAVLGRYGIKKHTRASVVCSLARGAWLTRARQMVLWNLKKPLKRVGGPVWFSVRRWFFQHSAAGR